MAKHQHASGSAYDRSRAQAAKSVTVYNKKSGTYKFKVDQTSGKLVVGKKDRK